MPVGTVRAAGASAERAFRTGVAGAARRGRLVLAFRTGVAARTLRTAGLPTAHADVFFSRGGPALSHRWTDGMPIRTGEAARFDLYLVHFGRYATRFKTKHTEDLGFINHYTGL